MSDPRLLPSACHDGIGTPDCIAFAAQYLAYTRPCQRFADCLAGQRVQVNGPRWRRVSLALLDVLRRSGPATVVRSCSEMPLFRPGNAPRSAMGSVPIKSVNLNSLP